MKAEFLSTGCLSKAALFPAQSRRACKYLLVGGNLHFVNCYDLCAVVGNTMARLLFESRNVTKKVESKTVCRHRNFSQADLLHNRIKAFKTVVFVNPP